MEIAPIPGIRSFGPTIVRRVDSQAQHFEVEAAARTDDETYSPSGQTPNRGLDEKESGAGEETENRASESDLPSTGATINIVA
jgi:hypothetical protein